jgi:hypothetical protein
MAVLATPGAALLVVNGVIPPTSINSRTRFFFLEEFTLFMLGLLTRIE